MWFQVQVYRFSISPTRIIPMVHDHLPGKSGIAYYNNLIDKLIENGITPMVIVQFYISSIIILSNILMQR